MSIFGRNLIDKLKFTLSHRSVLLPVPPYTDANYWNKVYENLTAGDVYEWGDFTLNDLLNQGNESPLGSMRYRHVYINGIRDLYGDDATVAKRRQQVEKGSASVTRDADADADADADEPGNDMSTITASDDTIGSSSNDVENLIIEEEFHRAIRVPLSKIRTTTSDEACMEKGKDTTIEISAPSSSSSSSSSLPESQKEQSILILGCGNSNFGEELYHYYHGHPSSTTYENIQPYPLTKIIQCDVSSNVVRSMNQRYNLEPTHNDDEKDDNNKKDSDCGIDERMDYDSSDFDIIDTENEEASTSRNSTTPTNNDYRHMSIVQADATDFPPTYRNKFNAVIDKGLIDALFCCTPRDSDGGGGGGGGGNDGNNDDGTTAAAPPPPRRASRFANSSLKTNVVPRLMKSVHGVLQPGAVFMFFSFSRPEYLLDETAVWNDRWSSHGLTSTAASGVGVGGGGGGEHGTRSQRKLLDLWSEVDVCELDRIFMYRFVKKDTTSTSTTQHSNNNSLGSSNYGLELDGLPSLRGKMKKRRK